MNSTVAEFPIGRPDIFVDFPAIFDYQREIKHGIGTFPMNGIGKSPINGPFSIAMFDYRRVMELGG